jgi:hypothetical protein
MSSGSSCRSLIRAFLLAPRLEERDGALEHGEHRGHVLRAPAVLLRGRARVLLAELDDLVGELALALLPLRAELLLALLPALALEALALDGHVGAAVRGVDAELPLLGDAALRDELALVDRADLLDARVLAARQRALALGVLDDALELDDLAGVRPPCTSTYCTTA